MGPLRVKHAYLWRTDERPDKKMQLFPVFSVTDRLSGRMPLFIKFSQLIKFIFVCRCHEHCNRIERVKPQPWVNCLLFAQMLQQWLADVYRTNRIGYIPQRTYPSLCVRRKALVLLKPSRLKLKLAVPDIEICKPRR